MYVWVIVAIIVALVISCVIHEPDPRYYHQVSATTEHLEGLPEWRYGETTSIWVLKQERVLEIKGEKKKVILLPFDQIEKVRIITWRKLRSRPADAVGRALVGSVIGGTSGMLLGALSAQNDVVTKTVSRPNCIEIIYHPKGNFRITQSLVFEPVESNKKYYAEKFATDMCRVIGLSPPEIAGDEPKYL